MPVPAPLDPKAVRQNLARKERLPTLPATYTKLIKIMGDPNATIVELTQIIQHDPVLTANVLKVANSAYAGGGGEPIEDLSFAIFRLGMKEIGKIALSVGYFDVFASKTRGVSEDFLKNLWTHSTAVALLGWRIAMLGRFEFEKDAYLVGLLHDMGKLFFATTYTAIYASLCKAVASGDGDTLTLESATFGLNHLEAAQSLCEFWKLPPIVVEMATRHHDPMSMEESARPLGLCLSAANVFAHHLIQDQPVNDRWELALGWLQELSMQAANPEQLQYEALEPLLLQEIEKAKQFMAGAKR
jgi:HD-like signal output (HDOD) protein